MVPPRIESHFRSEEIHNFHRSMDGKKLGVDRGHTDSDVTLIRDTRH